MRAVIGNELDKPGRSRGLLDVEREGRFLHATKRGPSIVLSFELQGGTQAQVWLDSAEARLVGDKLLRGVAAVEAELSCRST